MQNVFTDYPSVPWKPGWQLRAGPEKASPLVTGDAPGELSAPGSPWTLKLLDPTIPLTVRLLSNGFSLSMRKRESDSFLQVLLTEPGVLTGSIRNLPPPVLSSPEAEEQQPGLTWVKAGEHSALLQCGKSRFVLVSGNIPKELALIKAEEALEEDFEDLVATETKKRVATTGLFSINPRHNPPVALAAESLRQRLRGRTAALHGIWSAAEGEGDEFFSLNELYPLIHAWRLTNPRTALELMRTALSLQQSSGGFPAWVDHRGVSSSAAPWPLIIQSFEAAIGGRNETVLLKKTLPALRKYMQWALRRFDPHRDLIPAWQSEQEVFVPGSFERGKASADLTVMLLGELEALKRLCEQDEHSEAAADQLNADYDQLVQTLTTIFWNPEIKAFSNAWKEGHYIHEVSFASFMPLFWSGLPAQFRTPLLETFEETHQFPGQTDTAEWKKEPIDDTARIPAIHQFMALQALASADSGRALLMLFVRRTREGFAAWFERKGIEAARIQSHDLHTEEPAYDLGPVTAALLLRAQNEFSEETRTHTPVSKSLRRAIHRIRFSGKDTTIIAGTLLTMLIAHLLYRPVARINEKSHMADAALSYRQGQFVEALNICRRHPDNALSLFLRANLLMLTDSPEQAEQLYYNALIKETESPSALFGYALSLQMNGKFKEAAKRYGDFLDIHEPRLSQGPDAFLVEMAYTFSRLAEEQFRNPPKWRRAYSAPIMNDLGL